MCLGYRAILYSPAPPYVKQGTLPLSHLIMRMTEFARRATALISQDEVAVDVIIVQQRSSRRPLCCFLQLSPALAVRQSWVEGQGYWGLDAWGGKWPRRVRPEPWRSPGRWQPELSAMLWRSPRGWALALLALLRSSYFRELFTFCNFFF